MRNLFWSIVGLFGFKPQPIDPWQEDDSRSWIKMCHQKDIDTAAEQFGFSARFNIAAECAEIYRPVTGQVLVQLIAFGELGSTNRIKITTFAWTPANLRDKVLGMFDPRKKIEHTIK